VVVRRETLNQLGVVEEVHQLDLLTSGLPLLGPATFVELPRVDASRLFVGELEHQAELSPNEETRLILFIAFRL